MTTRWVKVNVRGHLYEQMREAAESEDRSVSSWLDMILERHFSGVDARATAMTDVLEVLRQADDLEKSKKAKRKKAKRKKAKNRVVAVCTGCAGDIHPGETHCPQCGRAAADPAGGPPVPHEVARATACLNCERPLLPAELRCPVCLTPRWEAHLPR